LRGVQDNDLEETNWIRGGQTTSGEWRSGVSTPQTWDQIRKEDAYYQVYSGQSYVKIPGNNPITVFLDDKRQFSNIAGGIFAPYALASKFDNNPHYGILVLNDEQREATDLEFRKYMARMTSIYSVDIVLTSDTNLWTRCPVIETGYDTVVTVNRAARFSLRKSPSVWRNGKPIGNGDESMGWFPGYVICVETGERLNVAFGENSMYVTQNGADMIFNPTDVVKRSTDGRYVAGGGHYLYIFGHRTLHHWGGTGLSEAVMVIANDVTDGELVCPYYMQNVGGNIDKGDWLKTQLLRCAGNERLQTMLFRNAMWTAIPLSDTGVTWLETGNDVTIKLRVTRPYQRWRSIDKQSVANVQNANMPLYKFATHSLVPTYNQASTSKEWMDSIFVVPNPYYGIATGGYEATQYETKVKIINLPNECEIKIYSLNGTLIRTLTKSNDGSVLDNKGSTFVEWDLKNSASIPIASGTYLIHIKDTKYKTEKTLKFVCVQRPVDVNAF
jgi:hypothetical protein